MKKYLIIDIGTSSLRVALLDDSYNILKVEVIKRVVDVTFDAETEWKNIFTMMKKITKGEKNINGAAVSSLMSWVGMDQYQNAITPCYTYMHQCSEEYEEFINIHKDIDVYDICKRCINSEAAVLKIKHLMKSDPEIFGKIKYFSTLKDFVNAKLTGTFGMDHTYAAYTLAYDVEKACWSKEMINAFGIDSRVLPKLYRPYESVGNIRANIQKELGIENTVPVACGSVDGSTGILGAGGVNPEMAVCVMGTTDVLFMIHKNPVSDITKGIVSHPHVFPGLYLSGGPMGIYGGTIDWFLNKVMNGNIDFREINKEAEKIDAGSDNLMAFPTLSGERTPFWNTLIQGTFIGIKPEHTPYHIFRAIMEADAYVCRNIAERGKAAGINFEKVITLGGGSKSDLWNQIKADVMGTEHCRSYVEEATMVGACMLAMLATGFKAEDIRTIPVSKVYKVDKYQHKKYEVFYKKYMAAHDGLIDFYSKIKNI